jgi:hypothetical protein
VQTVLLLLDIRAGSFGEGWLLFGEASWLSISTVFIKKHALPCLNLPHYAFFEKQAMQRELQNIWLVNYWLIVGSAALHFSSDEWPSVCFTALQEQERPLPRKCRDDPR